MRRQDLLSSLMTLNAIAAVVPPRGAPGAEIEIQGSGFLNATGLRFLGAGGAAIPAAQVAVSDTVLRATVPQGAVTGAITILDPDGNHVSPTAFEVSESRSSVAPELTTRGRDAINTLVLAMAAKQRGDDVTVANTYAREAQIAEAGGGLFTTYTAPSGAGVTPQDVLVYQSSLASLMPANFALSKMRIFGSVVTMIGSASGNVNVPDVLFVLRRTGDDFEIVTQAGIS